ncbi:diguanylate cyclase/phosphodiesterase with PAS/PAC sensor(s) [Lachnospiraceae bacterium KM106-2]|nr:diguanylate cyclase/phosphodiesterase with PAS/PAC sensor(s) [Lachnospiraceae bacterium KM106-2]
MKFKKFYDELYDGKDQINCVLRGKVANGNFEWLQLTGSTIYDNNGNPITVIGETININEKRMELELLKNATQKDPLTKVYKHHAVLTKIKSSMGNSNHFLLHAVLMIDIKHFKSINTTYGYTYGNAVLLEISSKLIKFFNNGNNLIGRFDGDKFILYLYNLPNLSIVESEAQKILNIFDHIYTDDKNKVPIHGCIGIALYPTHGFELNELIDKAYTAMIHARTISGNNYMIYSDSLTLVHVNSHVDRTAHNHYVLKSNSAMDSNILSNVVDILFDARQLDTSINIILSLLGDYYRLSSIAIFELSENKKNYYINYIWSSNSSFRQADVYDRFSFDEVKSYRKYHLSPNSAFYADHLDDISLPAKMKEKLKYLLVSGILQCGIYEGGMDKGFLSYHYEDETRSWNTNELNTLISISKILGGYLIKLRTQQKVNAITHLDSLTGCYNTASFTDLCYKILHKNATNNYIFLFLDIDKFKLINENYGYNEGDRILIYISQTLKEYQKKDEVYGRVGGDKFIMMMNYDDHELLLERVNAILKSLEHIPKTESDFYRLSIICGLCPVNRNINISINLDRANIARKSIQNRHKSQYTFFNEEMKSRLVKQREIEDIMEDALADHEFAIYYQPKVNLSDETLCGAEALIRWKHKNRIIPPDEFIPIFEENHFITQLDYYVLTSVCEHLRSLLDQKRMVVPISVNFSRVHLTNHLFVEELKNIVNQYHIPSNLIEIELTETAFTNTDSYLLNIMQQLHTSGFRIAMDDFGSGMSSLNLLRQLPFDVIKLDKDFFHQGTTTIREKVVITNIIKMARELKMITVSEGVETKEQAEFLKQIHCSIAQGYLYGKPMPVEQFDNMIH